MDKKKTKLISTSISTEHTNIRSLQPHYVRIVQNFFLIWLDRNINEDNNNEYRNIIKKLRGVVNTINIFTDIDECINFITNIKDDKAFMICSDEFSQIIVPIIHNMAQISAIYIFCEKKTRHKQLVKEWSKVKGFFTDIKPICESLKQAVHECNQNTISMSFVATSNDVTNKTLDQLDQSFMYTQILKEILLTINFEQKHIMEFIMYCREQFAGNKAELKTIDKLEKNYRRHTPIWWYTYHCFLYSMVNRVLRTMEIDLIIKLGFFICDLDKHIARLHFEQYVEHNRIVPSVVYRGQGLSQIDFDQLIKTKGGLLSFNNFLSTSLNRTVSLAFAESSQYNPDLIGVLFQITIDSSMSSISFANIRDASYYETEEEILFTMHSIFRIGEIKQIDENTRLWQVDLILTNDKDPQLHTLTERIREETTSKYNGWYRIGKLMITLSQFNKAEGLYEILLDQTSNEGEKAHVYHMLGMIKDDQGEYAEAITLYEQSIKINQKILSPTHFDLAASYTNMGSVYEKMGDYSKALSAHEKALEISQNTLHSNHLHLATFYNNIGRVYESIGEYSQALSFLEKALEIYRRSLPSNHPDLATSYNNIGEVYEKMGNYSKAFPSLEKALEIFQKVLPPNHPKLATSYHNMGKVLSMLGEYAKALSSHENALDMYQKILPPNHPSLATSHDNMGQVLNMMGEYSKALSSYEKALEIRQKALPPNHPHLTISYTNIGLVCGKMGDYLKAPTFLKHAINIREQSLLENRPHIQPYEDNVEITEKNL